MKRLLISFTCYFIFSCTLEAQQIQYGGEAGINISGAIAKVPGTSSHGTPLPGIQLGAFAQLPLGTSPFTIGARFLYSNESYKPDIDNIKANIHVSFLKLPVNVIYKPAAKNSPWEFGLGPFFGFGIGGHYTREDVNGKTKINFGSNPDKDDLKSLDIGADLMACYKLNDMLAIRGAFDAGLINYLAPGAVSDAHSLSFGISLCYTPAMK